MPFLLAKSLIFQACGLTPNIKMRLVACIGLIYAINSLISITLIISYYQRFRDIWFSAKKLPIPIANSKIFNTLISTDNAPPIDVFPTYDEQPGHSTDVYIGDPDYPAEAYF